MKPLRIKIQDEANLKKVPMHVIEKDYALSYVLAGMAKQPELFHLVGLRISTRIVST